MESSFVNKPKQEEIKIDCQICMSPIENDKDGFPLINCVHIFHKECLE